MRRTFSKEFKEEAVKLVLDQGVKVAQAAKDLGICQATLEKWVAAHRKSQEPGALTESEMIELKRLRKEVRVLRMERDILKKDYGVLREDYSTRCEWIMNHQSGIPQNF